MSNVLQEIRLSTSKKQSPQEATSTICIKSNPADPVNLHSMKHINTCHDS